MAASIERMRAAIPRFVKLAGERNWTKRITQLRRELVASPFRAKLASDYNWLELILADEIDAALQPRPSNQELLPPILAALRFAETVVETHDILASAGQQKLLGRLRDALKSNTGFASLFLEIDIARRLMEAGYAVEFSDMAGSARYDLRFWSGDTEGEVECKSQSVDAGRKIHRHDFYRFVDAVSEDIAHRTESCCHEAIIVTLDGRLPTDDTRQNELRAATRRLLRHPELRKLAGSFFAIAREHCEDVVFKSGSPPTSESELYERCRGAYGSNCHVSGALGEDRCCLIAMRSKGEDDTSAPLLDAIRKAASQFSGERPAFIAIQYDDLTVADLALPHVRRQAGALSYYLFLKDQASHVNATYFSAYGGMVIGPDGTGVPAFAVPNPSPRFRVRPSDFSPFLWGISDEDFARIVGAPPPTTSLSYIGYEDASEAEDN